MDEVARLGGIEIPFGRVPGRLLYTTPVATTLKCVVYAPEATSGQTVLRRIVMAHGEHDENINSDDDPWTAEESLAAITRHLPALAGARIEAVRVGIRPMPLDEKPMVGTSRAWMGCTWSSRTAGSRLARSGGTSRRPRSWTTPPIVGSGRIARRGSCEDGGDLQVVIPSGARNERSRGISRYPAPMHEIPRRSQARFPRDDRSGVAYGVTQNDVKKGLD